MRAIAACAFVLLGSSLTFARAPDRFTVAEFVADLDRISAALERAAPEHAATVAATVPLRWRVIIAPHEIEVDGTWLIHTLRDSSAEGDTWHQRRRAIHNRLLEIRAHAAELAAAPSVEDPSGRVRRAAAEILARPEYQQGATEQWLERIQSRIADWIRPLFRAFGVNRTGRRETAIVVAWIAGVAAFAALGIWLVRLLGRSRPAVTLDIPAQSVQQLSSREWARRAAAAARSGDYRESVRCAYNAAIHRLEEQGSWRSDPARTPREYLRLLPSDDVRRLPVRELTEQFERSWYGNRAMSDDDVRRVQANLERLGCAYAADRAI